MQIDDRITGRSKIAGIIGNPLEHSISPQLHNTLSRLLGNDLAYIPLRVEKNDLGNAVKGLIAVNAAGFNITIPYKQDIMKHLDVISEEALLYGAVNTVKNNGGKLYGYNTDADGFLRSFREEAGIGFENREVAVLGAGGAARAIAVKIALEKASRINIVNRTLSKASEIAEVINNKIRPAASIFSPEEFEKQNVISRCDIIVNTTSIGMYPDVGSSPVNRAYTFLQSQVVYDVIYNPVKTRLLKDAEGSGCKVVNGLGMLIYQGIYAYEIWTGLKVSESVVKELFKLLLEYWEHAIIREE